MMEWKNPDKAPNTVNKDEFMYKSMKKSGSRGLLNWN